MGYSTDFTGVWELSRPLTDDESNYLNKFADTRRMKRDVKKLKSLYKGEHGFNGDYGKEGEYFVGGGGFAGQDHDDTIIDFNTPPKTQPGLWCQWNVYGNSTIGWDGSEKFYNYIEWIEYIIKNFLNVWGVKVNGEIHWQGEDRSDIGKIVIQDSVVEVFEGVVNYEFRKVN